MRTLSLVLYNIIVVPLLYCGFLAASLINVKIRRGIKGRKKNLTKLRESLSLFDADRPRIWFHVSSYGEFLQVKPVLIQLRKLNPRVLILVSFFSPSGYDHVHPVPPIDIKCYLPFDSFRQAKKFVSIISPRVAAIVRHDIWPNFVWRLNQEKIPLILIDASRPQNSSRFNPLWKVLSKNLFSCMTAILAISESEQEKFRQLVTDPQKVIIAGDTKYDQVWERSHDLNKIYQLVEEPGLKQKKILVVGSSWQADEDYLIPAFKQLAQRFDDLIMILAPHEPQPSRIEELEHRLYQAQLTSVRLSQFKSGQFNSRCLIIDQIGLLANIYYLGTIAFVGGSFHYKIHNVLEPAVYGVPVLFGPKIHNSSEAQNLSGHEAAIPVNSIPEIVDVVTKLLENPDLARTYGERSKTMVMQHVGSSERIAQFLLRYAGEERNKL